jgi:hypothetical protein
VVNRRDFSVAALLRNDRGFQAKCACHLELQGEIYLESRIRRDEKGFLSRPNGTPSK